MQTRLARILYVLAFPTAITVIEILLEKNTELIQYHTWSWYWTFVSILATLLLSLMFNRWFFREGRSGAEGKQTQG
ncbi:hypothetical protein D3C84_1246840 [compost metagenome]